VDRVVFDCDEITFGADLDAPKHDEVRIVAKKSKSKLAVKP
jgi:hypothetical protein